MPAMSAEDRNILEAAMEAAELLSASGVSPVRIEKWGARTWQEAVDNIAIGFGSLISIQLSVNSTIPGRLDGSKQSTLNYLWALQQEVAELGNALEIKPWKVEKTLTDEQQSLVRKEFADIIAFFTICMVNIAKRLELSPQDFAYIMACEYENVSKENIERHGT